MYNATENDLYIKSLFSDFGVERNPSLHIGKSKRITILLLFFPKLRSKSGQVSKLISLPQDRAIFNISDFLYGWQRL